MSERSLHLGTNFSIPADKFVTQATAIVGKRGKGKSGAVKRALEELHRNRLPFVVFDPAGIHWAIRSSGDGKGPGLPVMVIGGKHGDLKLDRRAGGEVCRAIVTANISCVIDFKTESKAAYRQFITDFSHELFRIDGPPRVIFLEEAKTLVPQKIYKGGEECYEAVEKLVSQGRNEGIGVVLVGQRLANMAKDVVSEVDLMLIFGLVSPQDRQAVKEWVEVHGDQEKLREFDAGIASLQRREAYVWAPEMGVFQKTRILDFHTLHGDKTHLRELGLLETMPVEVDVSSVVSKLGEVMKKYADEKTTAADLPKLRSRIAELERQLAVAHSKEGIASQVKLPPTKSEVAAIEKPFRDEIAEKDRVLRLARNVIEKTRSVGRELEGAGTKIEWPENGLILRPSQQPTPRWVSSPTSVVKPTIIDRTPLRRSTGEGEDGELRLRKGAVRMLTELASRHPMTLTRAQLATLTGFTASGGTFNTYLGEMKRTGYLEEDATGSIHVTQDGLAYVGETPPAPSTHKEVMARWKQSLRQGNYRMLEVVVKHHPNPISRVDLGAEAEFEPTAGTFGTYLGILRRNNLVEVDGDLVKASETLWP